MFFSSLNQVRLIGINTIFGTEKAITVLGKTFVDHKVCNSLNEAIAECRSDLELGIAVLITCNADKFQQFQIQKAAKYTDIRNQIKVELKT
ncbi:MAG: hypothetical protein M1G31_19695 [Pseudanabaena sp. Salubria-1]|nr:hypothetical protein [Pseudanabaena sp. Salubria-1]